MNAFDHWALGAAVFLPAVAAGLLLLVPRAQETAQKAVALVFTVATTGVGVYLLTQFDYGNSRKLQFVVNNGGRDNPVILSIFTPLDLKDIRDIILGKGKGAP